MKRCWKYDKFQHDFSSSHKNLQPYIHLFYGVHPKFHVYIFILDYLDSRVFFIIWKEKWQFIFPKCLKNKTIISNNASRYIN